MGEFHTSEEYGKSAHTIIDKFEENIPPFICDLLNFIEKKISSLRALKFVTLNKDMQYCLSFP